MELGNLDLAILTAYQLAENWDAKLRVVTHVEDPEDREDAQAYLEQLCGLARLPDASDRIVLDGTLESAIDQGPETDLSIFPLTDMFDAQGMREAVDRSTSACVFTVDSGEESAMA